MELTEFGCIGLFFWVLAAAKIIPLNSVAALAALLITGTAVEVTAGAGVETAAEAMAEARPVVQWLAQYGYIGLFFGAFLAATIIPFSSDVLLVLLLTTGANPVTAVVSATLGNWLGGLTSYGLGYLGKWKWIEKWFGVTEEKLERQREKIQKYGSLLAFLTWLPLVGDVMAIGLGFYRIDFKKSAVFMLLGKGARFVMWAVAYYYISPYFMK